ncbi:hypothetical protein [Campylobacter corcagiensis]|uniref:Pyridoxamine 5'-phosphate oxidase family protein n=1 Tax=Campylobacter corcagiensis TaxID=1448857 RepID=A0A7M1LH98_9BACT|nr:hypothetical protein [Campylobacter corcagiensis]QKF64104.1 YhbP domain-containing protein [Campylobacter corcagiensis]QOQ87701.1 hypothetical protein IMC76_02495 [Campylobacter corcagiensis]
MRENFDKFIMENEILTICVIAENLPYCANSFYAYDSLNSALIIAGSSSSKHIKFGLEKSVSGTIFVDTKKIKAIKGLQFLGVLKRANLKEKKLYYKKFPFALLHKGEIFTVLISWAKFTDNSLKFGHKEIWQR